MGPREADNERAAVFLNGLEVVDVRVAPIREQQAVFQRRWLREELSFGFLVGCEPFSRAGHSSQSSSAPSSTTPTTDRHRVVFGRIQALATRTSEQVNASLPFANSRISKFANARPVEQAGRLTPSGRDSAATPRKSGARVPSPCPVRQPLPRPPRARWRVSIRGRSAPSSPG